MIQLHLAIHTPDGDPLEDDIVQMNFKSVNELIDYIEELHRFKDVIWLATEDGLKSEILITPNPDMIIVNIMHDMWNLCLQKDSIFHIQEYQSYESVYAVALDMKEGDPLQMDESDEA